MQPNDATAGMEMTGTIDGRWFKDALRDRKMTQRQLAKAVGMDPSSLSLLLSGKRRMTVGTADLIAKAIGVSLDEVIVHAGVKIGERDAPTVGLIGYVDGAASAHIASDHMGKVRSPVVDGCDAAIAMRTAQTELDMVHGWVGFLSAEEPCTDSVVDRTCVVRTGGETLLRLVRRGSTAGTYTLTGIGQPPIYDARVEWVRRVLMFRPM